MAAGPSGQRRCLSRPLEGIEVFGDIGGDFFLELAESRVCPVCRIGDCGLTRTHLGKAWHSSVGFPNLDGSQPLRSEGGSALLDAFSGGSWRSHGVSSV